MLQALLIAELDFQKAAGDQPAANQDRRDKEVMAYQAAPPAPAKGSDEG